MSDFPLALKTFNTCVLSDALDELGLQDRAMHPFVRPLDEGLSFYGRARTALYANAYSVEEGENPYELEIRLVDDLKPGDVPVFACDGPTTRMAPWGELLSTAATQRGATGCVTDGLVRDVRLIREMRFPVFAGGIGPLDSRGRCKMIEMDRPVVCGGVAVETGDLVFGDVDGVVVVPKAAIGDTISIVEERLRRETSTRSDLMAGALLADVYKKYGVL